MTSTVHTADAARRFDAEAIENLHIPSLVLMEHAAAKMTESITRNFPEATEIAILCGPGNNGADGLAIARLLAHAGRRPHVYIDENARLSPDEKTWLQSIRAQQIPADSFEQFSAKTGLKESAGKFDLIVDALFGSGLNRPLTGRWADLVEAVNSSGLPVVSVDIPSGINGNTGKGETAVQCDLTLALDCLKTGHLFNYGKTASGKIEILDITIPSWLHEQDPEKIFLIDRMMASRGLPVRSDALNKGRFGKILMCGGSLAMQGALSMAAMSCFHAGIGTLTLYTPKSAAQALASKLDLAMILAADEVQGFFSVDAAGRLEDLLDRYTFASCGNGMGTGLGAMEVTRTMLASNLGLVLDADGLNCAARHPEWLSRQAPLILTPHLAEFSRLSGFSLQEIEEDPLRCIRTFMEVHPNVILILKSDMTFVAGQSRIALLNEPCSALSKGGSGDVLAGLAAALCAQTDDYFEACCSAVYIHNRAARQACFDERNPHRPRRKINPACFTPLDLISHYSMVFNELDLIRQKAEG